MESPLERLRAASVARAAQVPQACDFIAAQSAQCRIVTNAAVMPGRAATAPMLTPDCAWLAGVVDAELRTGGRFELAPLASAAAPPARRDYQPFDLAQLRAAFSFTPGSSFALAESDRGAALVLPERPAKVKKEKKEKKERDPDRERRREERKRKREGAAEATGATGVSDAAGSGEAAGVTSSRPAAAAAVAVVPVPAPALASPQPQPPPAKKRRAEPPRPLPKPKLKPAVPKRPPVAQAAPPAPKASTPPPPLRPATAAPPRAAPAPAPAASEVRVSLQLAVPKGFAVESRCPAITPQLVGKRVVMRGVGFRGPNYCWGILKQVFKVPTAEGYNVEVAWGGGNSELRDARLRASSYAPDAASQEEVDDAWVLLRKI